MVKLVVEFAQVCFQPCGLCCRIFDQMDLPVDAAEKNLNKELVLITGAASGIGRLIALRLAKKVS